MKQLNARHRQSGGTFLGLILGLVIGLGIAVVVAMVITKVPTPFTDRFAHQEDAEVSANIANKNDPNRPMYGGAQQQTPSPVASAPSAAPSAPAVNDPIADLLASRGEIPQPKNTAPTPAPKAATQVVSQDAAHQSDEAWIYYLQTGAFKAWNEAESERARLALLGFEAKVSERITDNNKLYRVRMGPYAQVDAMNKVSGKLSDNGVDFAVIRTKKPM